MTKTTLSLTEKLLAKYDASSDQMAEVLKKLVATYGESDEMVLLCSKQLERRQRVVSYLEERAWRND